MSYIDLIKDKARQDKKTIVLPETNDKRTLIAAAHILEEKIARCEFDEKDDIKEIKEKITKIENNISTINQNIIELAKG